jgi:PAS domain S-box-containing protein
MRASPPLKGEARQVQALRRKWQAYTAGLFLITKELLTRLHISGARNTRLVLQLNRDIIERERLTTTLQAKELLFRQLTENIHEVFWVRSADKSRLHYVSPAFDQLFGFSHETVMRSPALWENCIHPEDRLHARAATGKECGVRFNHQYRIVRPDGSVRWVHSRGFPVYDPSGLIHRIAGLTEDITVQKQAEIELRNLSLRVQEAQDGERRRLARELHDSTAQQLAAISMYLDMLQAELPERSPNVEKLLSGAKVFAQQSIQEVRNITYLLHPPLLDQLGLAEALKEYVKGFETRSGLKISMDLPAEWTRLPFYIELSLFRVIQESLGNIYRHSGSQSGLIQLTRSTQRITLDISDKGHGFKAEPASANATDHGCSGVGLSGMMERIQLLNGEFEIRSTSAGTTVHATIPIPKSPV